MKKSWSERIAELMNPKRDGLAKLELDDVTGEKMVFPNIGDIEEVKEGVQVTATDGEHILTIGDVTYKVNVVSGIITSFQKEEIDQTAEFVESVVTAFKEIEERFSTALAETNALKTELAELKANLAHKPEPIENKVASVNIGGKSFDKNKIFKNK